MSLQSDHHFKKEEKKSLAEFFGYMTACLLFVYFKSQFFARHGVNIFYNQIVFYLNLFPSRANEFSFFYMSVKKSGSYITIPVFDVSWVVNFLKQVSMRFGIFKPFFFKSSF